MIKNMNRPELIQQLRRHAHPLAFHRLIEMPDWALRNILAWYESPEGVATPHGSQVAFSVSETAIMREVQVIAK